MFQDDPLFHDGLFHQKRKHGKWRDIPVPRLEASVADTHAHLQMLRDPALALARAGLCGVHFIEDIVDPTDDGWSPLDELPLWASEANDGLRSLLEPQTEAFPAVPRVRFALGVHPHNAKDYTYDLEADLRERLRDRRVSAVGEIGLDYHYDLSPRDIQQEVFRLQLRLAKEAQLPVCLHIREAHDDGFAILSEEGFPEAGTVLHCFNLDAEEVARWVEAGCYIAFGGPLTFKNADEVREAARLVPLDRLLTETDAPYMTPEPLRGTECEPAHTVLTAEMLCEVRGATEPNSRQALLTQVYENAVGLLDRDPTAFQRG